MDDKEKQKRPLRLRLFDEVDGSSLAYFRIAFGMFMIYEVLSFLSRGWVKEFFIDPVFHVTYFGFDWVAPLPGQWMYAFFALMGLSALGIMLGYRYRVSAVVFFILWTWMFFIDKTLYLNHFYFVSLVAFILIFVPAHRVFSLDAKRDKRVRRETIPLWSLWLLRIQLGIPYFFGGIAKLSADWLQGEPMGTWLAERADRFAEPIRLFFTSDYAGILFSYGGLAYDLFIVPAFLWRRTRWFALAGALGFNLTNSQLFNIGIFPWLMIAISLMYFDPMWPKWVMNRLGLVRKKLYPAARVPFHAARLEPRKRILLAGLGVYLLIQFLLPLRQHVMPGNALWTYEGYYFSWLMKLKDKEGSLTLLAGDPLSNRVWEIDTGPYMHWFQTKDAEADPDAILQIARYAGEQLRAEGYEQIEIHAIAPVSINGRVTQMMIDPEVDLMQVERKMWGNDWILPLTTPLTARASDTLLR